MTAVTVASDGEILVFADELGVEDAKVPVTATTIADLRTKPAGFVPAMVVLSDANGNLGIFKWDAASASADNGVVVVKPNGVASSAAGRWLRTPIRIAAADLLDASAIGRALIAAASQPAARSAIDAASQTDLLALQGAMSGGAILKESWAALSALTGTANGQRAEILTDTGTHADPVVGGTVPNSGVYSWSPSPAGWKRIGDVTVSLVTSLNWAWKVEYSDLGVPLGVDAGGIVRASQFYSPSADFDEARGPVAKFGEYRLGSAKLSPVESSKYLWKIEFADLGVPLGIGIDGKVLVDGQPINAVASAGGLSQPDWTADYASLVTIHSIGQSLSVGRGAVMPTAIMDALSQPVSPGRAFQFGDLGPRILGEGTPSFLTVYAAQDRFTTVRNHKEMDTGLDGATTNWTMLDVLLAKNTFPNKGFLTANTAIGGASIEEARGLASGSRMADNRRRAIRYMDAHGRQKGVPVHTPAILVWDHGNRNRADSLATYKASVEGLIEDWFRDLERNGGSRLDAFVVLGSPAGVYTSVYPSSDVGLVQLALHEARSDVGCWGPEYVCESASGVYSAGNEDTVHRAAIGQARAGVYMGLLIDSWAKGARRTPLHVDYEANPLNAKVTSAGLVTLTFTNPRAGALVLDTSFVTDPGGNRPYGFAYAAPDGKAPHATIQPVAGSFAVAGNVLTFQLSAPPGANPYINVAAYENGGTTDPITGPTMGARACLRNDGSADTRTYGGISIVPHDYAMPQRIPLTLV